VPLISRANASNTGSDFDFSSNFQVTDYTDMYSSGSTDMRLMLHNVPTGCYRFKYVYAPTGQGSLSSRTINDMLNSAQAVSYGASRPFRVLSPIMSMTITTNPSIKSPRNTPLMIPPVLSLKGEHRVTDIAVLCHNPGIFVYVLFCSAS
jgi:hypothetical protein